MASFLYKPLSIHPSGVPYPLIHICSNCMILIAESGCGVVKLHDHLGNAGLMSESLAAPELWSRIVACLD